MRKITLECNPLARLVATGENFKSQHAYSGTLLHPSMQVLTGCFPDQSGVQRLLLFCICGSCVAVQACKQDFITSSDNNRYNVYTTSACIVEGVVVRVEGFVRVQ